MSDMRDTQVRERAILVGLATRRSPRSRVKDFLDELALLAQSAGADVVFTILQERTTVDAAHFIGKGKAEEIGRLVHDNELQLVIFDDDLSTVQVRNLERMINCKIMDRSGLILDIFASRARSREAKTQVELAQLQYMLPRLTRQWTHLSKQFGGIGTKGPGETQIETDRRAIRARITHLSGKLKEIAQERATQRKGRDQFPRVALIGYTNAGKSTILNWFTDAGVLVEDRLFATLDSTVRLVKLSPASSILLSDTVGFIRKLPHHLVASFKSTLDEVREAELLLHIVDLSHPLFEDQIAVVNETLAEIGAAGKPVITVFNKIDRLENRAMIPTLIARHPNAVCVSALRSIQMTSLQEKIIEILEHEITEQSITLSVDQYPMIAQIHENAEVLDKQYDGDRVTLRFRMHRIMAERLRKAFAHSQGSPAPARRRKRH
jgi:GTPase